MLDVFWWFLTIQVIGLASFPLAYHLFPNLKDNGYTISKTLGLLLLGYLVWILSYFHIISNTTLSLRMFSLTLIVISAIYIFIRWKSFYNFFITQWKNVVIGEIIFCCFFIGWILIRSYDPSISSTEKPMDFAFLNASLTANFAPPKDPWLIGYSISYYYFGYWIAAILAKITGVGGSVSYNIALALIPSLAAIGLFGLISNFCQDRKSSAGHIILGAITGVLLLLMIGNLEGVLELFKLIGVGTNNFWDWIGIKGLDQLVVGGGLIPQEHWWWWRATRVIDTLGLNGESLDYTIQEFPFFSFLLGDLHAHIMSLPFVILFLSFMLQILFTKYQKSIYWVLKNQIFALLLALSLGALAFINIWDFVIYSSLLAGGLFLWFYRQQNGFFVPLIGLVILISAKVLILGSVYNLVAYFFEFTFNQSILITSGALIVINLPLVCLAFLLKYTGVKPRVWAKFADNIQFSTTNFKRMLLEIWALCIGIELIIGLAILFFLPFYISFNSQVSAIVPVIGPTTRPIHLLIVWGCFFVIGIPLLLESLQQSLKQIDWWKMLLISSMLAIAPYLIWVFLSLNLLNDGYIDHMKRFISILPIILLATISIFSCIVRFKKSKHIGEIYILLIFTLAIFLIYGPELFFVKDFFNNRMNTVFKFYYQAWLLLSLVSAFSFYKSLNILSKLQYPRYWVRGVCTGLFLIVFVISLYYPIASVISKTNNFSSEPTLDGLNYMIRNELSEYKAIQWLNENDIEESGILEAVGTTHDNQPGGDYDPLYGRISASTGIPTILGWYGHEHQWRGDTIPMEGRFEDIITIYNTHDIEIAIRLLKKYHIEYVYIGNRERSKYNKIGLAKFPDFMETVYPESIETSDNESVIYKLR